MAAMPTSDNAAAPSTSFNGMTNSVSWTTPRRDPANLRWRLRDDIPSPGWQLGERQLNVALTLISNRAGAAAATGARSRACVAIEGTQIGEFAVRAKRARDRRADRKVWHAASRERRMAA